MHFGLTEKLKRHFFPNFKTGRVKSSRQGLFVCMRPVTSIFVKKHFLATNVEQVEESTVSKEKQRALQAKKKKK